MADAFLAFSHLPQENRLWLVFRLHAKATLRGQAYSNPFPPVVKYFFQQIRLLGHFHPYNADVIGKSIRPGELPDSHEQFVEHVSLWQATEALHLLQ